jgi:CelD/BcsL family acetyltransferase involved in cellulose biosynthesis
VKIQVIDPVLDRRWDELVARHPKASVFHGRDWLEGLVRTYGYKPCVLTTAAAGEALEDGIVLCRVSSWMTGTRLVSLPFSDHCEPLLRNDSELPNFINWLRAGSTLTPVDYVELRPLSVTDGANYGLQANCSYWYHELDLTPPLEQIFQHLHKNSFKRKIRRAERERLSYESGRSKQLLDEFCRLLRITRRRHQLPPQPRAWFRNLLESMGERCQIRLTRKNGVAIAAMLTLRHRSTAVYKYGCSDEKFHNLGGMPFLFWRLIEESRAAGVDKIDFGRTELKNEGLITFKDRLGASKKLLTYCRYSNKPRRQKSNLFESPKLRQFISYLPNAITSAAGRVLYRHIG